MHRSEAAWPRLARRASPGTCAIRASPGQDLAGPGLQAEEAVPIPISAAMCLELADACARLELARGADAEMPLMPARPAGLPGPPWRLPEPARAAPGAM